MVSFLEKNWCFFHNATEVSVAKKFYGAVYIVYDLHDFTAK